MKRTLVAALVAAGIGCGCYAEEASPLSTPRDKVSYGVGMQIGRNLLRQGMLVDSEVLARGIRDALAQSEPAVSEAEFAAALEVFQKKMTALRSEQMDKLGRKNLAEGPAFLAENRKKPGIQVTKSGLQYEVLQEGTGASPTATDTVVVHYHGQLLDGTVFDSSVDRDVPVELPVNRVIPGWTEALQMMKVGDKWKLFIPAELAYKDAGSPPTIGPHATLVFSVELLEIKQPQLDLPSPGGQ